MKNTRIIGTIALTFALCAGTTFAEEEKDEKVALSSLPEAARTTLVAQATAKDATLGDIEKETEDGKVTYEAKLLGKDGAKSEVEVAGDGSLIKAKADDDEKEEKGDDDDEEEK